jgi:hypothetical protein
MRTNDNPQELVEEHLIRSYFLGDLPKTEQEQVLERLFLDQDFFETSLVVEGELVDDYALGLISDRERAKLERGLLMSPHEYRKVEFVKILDRYLTHNRGVESNVRSTAPSFFTRLRSRFVKSRPPSVERSRVGDAKAEKANWEGILGEAHANRTLLFSLIADNWLGLKLLLQLQTIPQATQADLASLIERDDAALKAALARLIDKGLMHQAHGRYSSSSLGLEILEKLREVVERP